MLAANIITVYKQPTLVEALLRTMQHSCFHFYLHIDRKVDIRQFEYLAELPTFFIDKRFDIKWAGYSIVEASLWVTPGAQIRALLRIVSLSCGQYLPAAGNRRR